MLITSDLLSSKKKSHKKSLIHTHFLYTNKKMYDTLLHSLEFLQIMLYANILFEYNAFSNKLEANSKPTLQVATFYLELRLMLNVKLPPLMFKSLKKEGKGRKINRAEEVTAEEGKVSNRNSFAYIDL